MPSGLPGQQGQARDSKVTRGRSERKVSKYGPQSPSPLWAADRGQGGVSEGEDMKAMW